MPLPIPFFVQVALTVAAFLVAPRIAHGPRALWIGACVLSLALLLCWPLMRVAPVHVITLLGAPGVACIELTGLAVPAVLLFGVASRHLPKASDRRAVLMLTAVAAIYFVKAGWWMVSPGVSGLKPTLVDADGVCRQSTGYTCVAASMVTLLHARGVPATESEMARLAYTQVGGGATDSRAVWALEEKLRGSTLSPCYRTLDRAGLIHAAKPCLVQLDWGYFVSHMVPVMEATEGSVVIGDPISGRREMTMQEFMAEWKGKAITVE